MLEGGQVVCQIPKQCTGFDNLITLLSVATSQNILLLDLYLCFRMGSRGTNSGLAEKGKQPSALGGRGRHLANISSGRRPRVTERPGLFHSEQAKRDTSLSSGREAETLFLQLAALLEPRVTQGYLKTGQRQLAPVSMVT